MSNDQSTIGLDVNMVFFGAYLNHKGKAVRLTGTRAGAIVWGGCLGIRVF